MCIVNLKGQDSGKENSDGVGDEMKIEVEKKGGDGDKKEIIEKEEMILIDNDNNEHNGQVMIHSSDRTEVRQLVNVNDN